MKRNDVTHFVVADRALVGMVDLVKCGSERSFTPPD
jgi:hypothetical protein